MELCQRELGPTASPSPPSREWKPICASVSPFLVNDYQFFLCEQPTMWFTDSLKINQKPTQLPKAKRGILFPVLV